jgi:hypothetical protein
MHATEALGEYLCGEADGGAEESGVERDARGKRAEGE